MARPREFEPGPALDRAMRLFWRQGYDETSMADLVEATGVSRYGFYSEFGDKHDLFLKCLDHYATTAIDQVLSPMERADASLPAIRDYFENLRRDVTGEQPATGCLIGFTALSTAALESDVVQRLDNHFDRMHNAFRNALTNAVQFGELSADEDVDALADYLVGTANGYLACLRAGMSPAAVEHYLTLALQRLD